MASDLEKKASSLEDEFFRKEDQKLMARLRELEKVKETQAELAKVSGIKDEAVLKKLVALHIHPQTLAALATIPLVEVAWADGAIDDKERKAILDASKQSGGVDTTLLEQWLAKKPEAKLLDAWKVYVQGLAKELGAAEFAALKSDLLGRARNVAEASGGLLGLGNKVSAKEAAMLKTLEGAFGK